MSTRAVSAARLEIAGQLPKPSTPLKRVQLLPINRDIIQSAMPLVIEADSQGTLSVPAAAAPGTRFAVEPHGDVVILRREPSSWREPTSAEIWWRDTSPDERIAWLREWIASLPPSPPLSLEAVSRDSLYE